MAVCNCSGVENIKEALKLLLKRRELAEALRDTAIHIVIAADRDKRPTQAIKDMLQSLGYTPAESGGTTVIPPLGLPIHVIEQGGREDTATGQIEDELLKLVELVHPGLTQAAARLEEAHGALDNKLLYLALLNRRPGIRYCRKPPHVAWEPAWFSQEERLPRTRRRPHGGRRRRGARSQPRRLAESPSVEPATFLKMLPM